jgi:hypothetical protein
MLSHLMPFGKHKGKALADIPSSYLGWLLRECRLSTGVRSAVAAELESRGGKAPAPPSPKPEPDCRPCGAGPEAISYSWLQTRNGGRQISRRCSRCGEWLGSAPHVEPFVSRADAAASATPVLDVLTGCEELGIRLRSDGAAAGFASYEDCRKAPQELRALVRQCRHSLARMIGKDPDPARDVQVEVVSVVDKTPGGCPLTAVPTGKLQHLLEHGNLDQGQQVAVAEELSRRIEQRERGLRQRS